MTFNRRGGQYQRNTQGGRVVDTGPPRTTSGLTGLGAVGGKTGVGAGALRVIVEFLTQYDSKEVERLEAELEKLQNLEDKHNQRQNTLLRQQAQSQGALTRVQNLRQKADLQFTKEQRKEILAIRDLERSGAKGAKTKADETKKFLAQQTGFTKSQITQLVNQDRITARAQERRLKFANQIAAVENRITTAQKAQVVTQGALGRLQNLKAQLGPRLGSLALGAVGGIFGGAVVGIGFAAAQGLLDAIGSGLEKILDPAKEAREALSDVAESVNKLAETKGLTLIQAAKEELEGLGEVGKTISPDLLAAAAALQSVVEENEKLAGILAVVQQQERLSIDTISRRAELLAEQQGQGAFGLATIFRQIAQGAISPEQAFGPHAAEMMQFYATALEQVADKSATAGQAQRDLAAAEQAAANAAAFASVQQDRLANALSNISNMRIGGLQDQLSALGDAGPSGRTQQLEASLQGLAEAQAQNAYASQLAQIQEERGLVLLEQRIRFQGESVRLDGLSAKAQLVAVDARIAALQRAAELDRQRLQDLDDEISKLRKLDQDQDERDQKALEVFDERIALIRKEQDAQDKLNQLLDLQYRLGQTIHRQEGETIGDFLARRANETRSLLAEQASLQREDRVGVIEAQKDELAARQEVANERRENAIEAKELEKDQLEAQLERIDKARQAEIRALNDRRDRLQLEVKLQDLAEREKQLAAQETARKQQKYLQDALRASQEADRKAVDSRRAAIEKQIKAEEEKLKKILYWTDVENIERMKAAIAGANSYGELQTIIGEVAGAKRVLGELRALVNAGVLPYSFVSDRIANLVQLIRDAEARIGTFVGFNAPRLPAPQFGPTPLAKGGIFMLNNAMNNPFGANIRTGEEGHELGVVLPNRVAQMLEKGRPQLPPIAMTINRSPDPWLDYQRSKRAMREAIEESLR